MYDWWNSRMINDGSTIFLVKTVVTFLLGISLFTGYKVSKLIPTVKTSDLGKVYFWVMLASILGMALAAISNWYIETIKKLGGM